MSSGANLLMAVMATCSVAVGGVKTIFFFFFFILFIQMAVSLLKCGSLRLGSLGCVFVYLFGFLCIYSDFGVLIYKGFEFFFSKIVYGPKNGLGFFFFFFSLKVEQIIYLFIYLRVFLILIKGDPSFF